MDETKGTFWVEKVAWEERWSVTDPLNKSIALCANEDDAQAIVDALWILHKLTAMYPGLMPIDYEIESSSDIVDVLCAELDNCEALRLNFIEKYKREFDDYRPDGEET